MSVLAALQASPELFVALATIAGFLVGSFLNVVVHRLPKIMERDWRAQAAELLPPGAARDLANNALPTSSLPARYNLIVPRSACPTCGHQITALENVPILSYLFLRGRCSACGAKISARYPLVEAVAGVAAGLIAWHFGFGWEAFGAIGFVWALLALALIDFDTQFLPDAITYPLLWAGLLINLFSVFTDIQSAVWGAVLGYMSLWSVYWLFKLLTGKEGMGYGDFKLLGAIGAWLGWQKLPVVILLSSVVGAVVGILVIVLARRGRNVPIPFGPYLAGGGVIAMFFGQALIDWYMRDL